MTTLSENESISKSDASLPTSFGAGDNPLSEREMEVARLLATGLSNAEIARQLVISPHTVKVHLRNIFEKLQVNSRTEASMSLVQRGWLIIPGVEIPLAEPTPQPESTPPPAPDPEPEPLLDLPAQVMPWQRFYLLAALLVCLLVLIAPNLRGNSTTSPELLSDAERPILGKPLPQIYPRWSMRTPMKVARSRLALARVDDHLYILGGQSINGQILADVDAYDLRVNQWESRQPLPIPLANLAATALDGQIYIAGGANLNPTIGSSVTISDAFFVYNPSTDHWQNLGALPHALAGAQLAADQQALYLVGGWDGQTMRDEVWRFVPTQAQNERPTWELLTHLDKPRAFLGTAVVGDDLYVVGGYDGHQELDQATVYSFKSGAWRTLPPLSNARGGLSLVYDGQAIFALGGGWTHPLDTLERYDPTTNLWSNFPSPIQGEWLHLVATSYADRIYLLGGWSGDYLDFHLEYQSTLRSLFLPGISNK